MKILKQQYFSGIYSALVLVALFVGSCALAYTTMPQEGFASSELRFSEMSATGLAIVPASCPSDPHWAGECNDPIIHTPSGANLICGEDSTLHWMVSGNLSCSLYIGTSPGYNGDWVLFGGSVYTSTSGSYNMGPITQTKYAWLYCGSQHFEETVSCTPPSSQCPNGLNVVQYPSCVCPSGQTQSGNQCVSSCQSGYTWDGSQCVVITCPTDYSWNGSQCTCSIPGGDITGGAGGGGGCVGAPICPSGYTWNGTLCSPPQQCTQQYFCGGSDRTGDGVGDDRWLKNTQCVDSFSATCAWGCINGQCLPAPEGLLSIRALPSLVRSGEVTTVTWTAEDVQSCTIDENNPNINDAWSGATIGCADGVCSGSHESGSIAQQTRYTLRCTGLDDEMYTDTATVNILPVFKEL